jgi:RNA polymerase sigma-70 factor (ECF subfamily)
MTSPVEITWLLASVAKGDEEAFERLYAATRAKIYGVVLRILRRHDLASDVMEAVYLQIRQTGGEFDPTLYNPVAWMVSIARRRAIDLARSPQGGTAELDPDIADTDNPGVLPRRELSEELKRLLTCIGRLDPDSQRMLLLAYYGAFSRDVLADKLDTPPSILKASLRRSLAEIERCLTS